MDALPAGRLPPNSVYRSLAGRAAFHVLYDSLLSRLPRSVRLREVPTSFGRTHVTIAGNPEAPPVLVLPGMSVAGPLMLDHVAPLLDHFQLIAPDLIGHPGRSEDRLHSPRNHGYGRWLIELLDGLGLGRVDIVSGSFGSSMGLDLAAIAPERVGKQALISPSGLTPNIPYAGIYRRFLMPWLIYRAWPDRSRLPQITKVLCNDLRAEDYDYFDIVIREAAFWRSYPAGPFLPRHLLGYREPVLLVTAGRDHVFPRARTLPNALKALNVTEEIHLPDSAHVPSEPDMARINRKIVEFLAA